MTPTEYERIAARAENSGLSISAYIRHRLKRVADKRFRIQVYRVMLDALARLDELNARENDHGAIVEELGHLRHDLAAFLDSNYHEKDVIEEQAYAP